MIDDESRDRQYDLVPDTAVKTDTPDEAMGFEKMMAVMDAFFASQWELRDGKVVPRGMLDEGEPLPTVPNPPDMYPDD